MKKVVRKKPSAEVLEIARKIEKLPDFEEHLDHLSCIYCREWWVRSYWEMEQENASMRLQVINMREAQKTQAAYQARFIEENKGLRMKLEAREARRKRK